MIKIGIVLPTYKREQLVTRAIQSIIDQNYENFVICVVEDCSPDNTQEVMKQYTENEKIHYIRLSKNSGVNTARNRALDYLTKEAIGCDYITLLDDDDFFLPNVFQYINNLAQTNDDLWYVFSRVHPSGEKTLKVKEYGSFDFTDYLLGKITGDTSMWLPVKAINGLRFEESFNAREYLFFLLISKNYKMNIYNFDAVVCEYLEDGLTKASPSESKSERNRIRNIESRIIKESLGISYSQLEVLKAKEQFKQAIKSKNLKNIERYLRRILKWKLRRI